MIMEKKKARLPFESPAVLKVVRIAQESEIMAGSVVTGDSKVRTAGQEVQDYDFSDTSFNQEWETGSTN